MHLRRVIIRNFKRFRRFDLSLGRGVTILVGDNEAGKSTVLEAIQLALTGLLGGRYLKGELSQDLFNSAVVASYLASIRSDAKAPPPDIVIELYFSDCDAPALLGNGNSQKENAAGFRCAVEFDERFADEYAAFVASNEVTTLPIEYYDVNWTAFSREPIAPRNLPVRCALVDSSSHRYRTGSDVHAARIIRDRLRPSETVKLSQAYRRMKDGFRNDRVIQELNEALAAGSGLPVKDLSLTVDLPGRADWEESIVTCIRDVPFHHLGMGTQCIVKTRWALQNPAAKKASILLLEEPESHLSHTNLNELLRKIEEDRGDRQVIATTHSSFVANKLSLTNITLLSAENGAPISFESLDPDTVRFFEKAAGYDTLRLVLAKRAILVEGPSDELVVQRAYMDLHKGHLPIEDGIDVISVGTSFLRFIAIAERLGKPVSVVTDNDGDLEALKEKYDDYLDAKGEDKSIRICFDETGDTGPLAKDGFNYNTLEPKLVKANSADAISKMLGRHFGTIEELHRHMRANETECALQVFAASERLTYPKYIRDAVSTYDARE